MHQLEEIRTAISRYPVVALIGARGTGKTLLADALTNELDASGVTVVRIDARDADSPYDLNAAVAAALKCDPDNLDAQRLPEEAVVRVIVDNCHELFDRAWFPYLQENWRGLVTSESARGRIGILLLGRPLFRNVAGGEGSPLLGVGPLLVTRPLTHDEVSSAFDLGAPVAAAVCRKTGGHPALSEALVHAIDGDIGKIGGVIGPFSREQERYLMGLAQDHSLAALGILADVARVRDSCSAAALARAHFGGRFAAGQEALRDLEASGMVARDGDEVHLAAEIIRQVDAVREFIRAPDLDIPAEPPEYQMLAADELYRFENELRSFINEVLGGFDPAWWPARVPEEYVGAAELRRRAELDSAVAPDQDPHPIYFLSLGELFEIVLANENWNRAFGVSMRHTREMIRAASQELFAVRNKVAHSRPVRESDLALLRLTIQRIGLSDSR